jgi:hypothetical protein
LACGNLYVSTNSGNAWTQLSNLSAGRIASSADGRKLVAAGSGALIYDSTDYGLTWTTNVSPSGYWSSVVSSADGTKLAAAVNGGGIWTSQTAPAPFLNIMMTNGNLTLSWIDPSANFILQQISDLTTTNWTGVTNMPALNLTNLQNDVTLPLPISNTFYRLKSP